MQRVSTPDECWHHNDWLPFVFLANLWKGKQKTSKQSFLSGSAKSFDMEIFFFLHVFVGELMTEWQTPSVVTTNTLLHIIISKTKTNNEIRFKVAWVDICQKLSNLQKTLTSFASAGISRQLLRPGPLFLKVNDITIYIWSTFCPSECWCKFSIFQLRFWWLVLEVNHLKWKCLKRKKCNDCWRSNKM